LARARGGNVAMVFSLLLPALLLVGAGAVELNQVLSDTRRTQDVADSAALMGAGQLGVSPVGADQRAQSYALAQLGDVAQHATVSTSATVGANQSMTVTVDTQRVSFFGNFLPPGGFHTHVSATAKGLNNVPLCVLGSSLLVSSIHINSPSQLQAGQCLVHSNSALTVDPGGALLAQANEATLTATGSITAAAQTLAPSIPDPFAKMSLSPTPACPVAPGPPINVTGGASQTLPAGVHTGPVGVTGGSTLTLAPGDHWFCQTFTVSGNSTVSGTDVDLIFEPGAILSPSGSKTTVNLSGRQSGAYAGFVLIADRTYAGSFALQSDFITGLTGTVYVPSATLAIQGTAKAGGSSPWTVLDAQNITIANGAQIVINADYSASNVPVPTGVGDKRPNTNTQLQR
jgi:Flp pilus assembly protein TadG